MYILEDLINFLVNISWKWWLTIVLLIVFGYWVNKTK